MSEEIKKDKAEVRSFRVTDDVMAKFNTIKDELKLNQDGALGVLIGAYEMEKAKEAIPDRETEIANFQLKAHELVEAFLHSLQLNQDAEARIRQEFEAELVRNKKTIDNYQGQIEALKAEKALLSEDAAKVKFLQTELDSVTEQARKERNEAADRIAEKDRLISTLDGRLEMVEIQAAGYDKLKDERDSLARQLQEAQSTVKEQDKDHQMEMERAAMAARQAQDEAVAAAKAEADGKIASLKEQLQEAKIAGAKDLQAAEKAAHEADKVAAAEIRKLEQENARLRELMAEMKAKMSMEE